MVIGRTDEQQNPLIPMALTCRAVVWMSLAEPIWASGHVPASKAGHMTAFEPTPAHASYLNPTGRPHMVLYQPPWRLTHRKQGKAFFFEKKKQKAFVCAVADLAGKVRVSTNKSFLVLFLEKGLLACYESWSRPAGITLKPCARSRLVYSEGARLAW